MQPIGSGTHAQRTVLAGRADILQLLLELESQTRDISMRTPVSSLRRMLAYATKLHHARVIQVLVDRMGAKGPGNIQIWDNGRLLTLDQLWTNPTSGFNWPERFSRIMRFGENWRSSLSASMEILKSNQYAGKDLRDTLAVAICYSRRDAVGCLIQPTWSSQR